MRSLTRGALAGALFAFLCLPSQAADPGRTVGTYGVSPSGAATYSIKIWTPPGPNGLTPSISLDYNSQSGNSLLGVGWNLTATSAIERCNRTKVQDSSAAPIDLSLNDRFCLSGKRLRLSSGTYGVAGSVYFTEVADYSRITAFGSAGSGPDHFIVEAKDGLKYEYGNSPNSRVAFGATVLRWMLNKVYDRNNNSYVISYNNANGFAYPDVISWTPSSQGASTYKYEAKFNYINGRNDKDSYRARVAGFDVYNNNRLDSIQIKSGSNVKRQYRLSYDSYGGTARSTLASVKECSDEFDVAKCLLPTTFTYQSGMVGLTPGAATPPAGSSNGIVVGRYDLNGDGKDDIVYLNGGICTAALGALSGFSAPISVGPSSCGVVDRFLPKGRDAIATLISGSIWVYRWDDATAAFVGYNTGIAGTSIFPVDYDGDGLADLVTRSADNKSLYIRRNTSTGSSNPSFAASTFLAATLPSSGPTGSGTPTFESMWTYFGKGLKYTDINGDGRQDFHVLIRVQFPMGVSMYSSIILGSSAGFYIPPNNTWQTYSNVDFPTIDFNGDACTDRLGGSTVYISQCNGIAASTVTVPATPLQVIDWDGDGKTDFLVNSGGNFAVYLSTGTGFSGPISPTTAIPSAGTFFAVDQDGDRMEDLIRVNGSSAISYWTHNTLGYVPTTPGSSATNIPDLMSSATDGFGVTFSPKYYSTAWGGYDKGADTAYPLQEADPAIVVAQVTASNGIGGTYNKTYYYQGARVYAGRGYSPDSEEAGEPAGFQRIDATDMRNGLITRTYYEQTFPLTGMVSQRELMQPNGTDAIARTVYTNAFTTVDPNANNYFAYSSGSTSTEYGISGLYNAVTLKTVTTINTYDFTSGTAYDQKITIDEPVSGANGVAAGGSWSARRYTPVANLLNDPANWCLGRPQQIQQINSTTVPTTSSITRTTNISWNATYCRPTQAVAEPGNSTLQVTTDFGYDSFGNVNSTTVTGIGMDARLTTATFADGTNTTGQFPLTVTEKVSASPIVTQTSAMAWNYDIGVPTSATDPNGIQVFWQYDPYGRRTREDRPDGTFTIWSLTADTGAIKTIVQVDDYAPGYVSIQRSYEFLDQFDRPTIEYLPRPDGVAAGVWRGFDASGNLAYEYFPFPINSTNVGSRTMTYDVLNRPLSITRPVSDAAATPTQTTNIEYLGLTTKVKDALGRYSYRVSNAAGQIARSKDDAGYYQDFEYDAFGDVTRVSDGSNTLQSSLYNLRGMLTQRTDMDMGTWSFTPDALGETVSQTDAKGQPTSFTFDLLGRLTSRTETEGTSSWNWGVPADNTASNKYVGTLKSISGPGGYSEVYTNDAIARLTNAAITADSTTYNIGMAYNSIGALDTLTYPASTGASPLKLQYEYQLGFLYRIKDFNTPSTVYWTANSFNGRNQITQESLGNGLVSNHAFDAVTGWPKTIQTGAGGGTGVQNLAYAWDLVGNLTSRKDLNQSNLTETFTYDNLNRLDQSQLNGVMNQNVDYDALGNITNKLDVGSYTYHSTKKHQVVSTGSPTNWTFSYDNNGNMTTGRGGVSIDWTSYNYPSCIRMGSTCTGSSTDYARFSYTPDRQYWKQEAYYTGGSGGAATTYYVGGILEKVMTSAGTDYRHMIRAGNSTIIVSRQSGGTNSVYYMTQDHLGSSSAITNSAGATLVNESFDAYGKRRGSNWTGSPYSGDWTAIATITRRGFTDHSMLDNLGLIHMNGRVQDPWLGRFLSADPFIPEPLDTQSFNRYSYVQNNPLSYIDPSGFEPDWIPNWPTIPNSPAFPACRAKPCGIL